MSTQHQKKRSLDFKLLLEQLFKFQPVKECADEIWRLYVPPQNNKQRWLHLHFTKYQNTIYWIIDNDVQLEFDLKKEMLNEKECPSFCSEEHDFSALIKSCIKTLKAVEKDWLNCHRSLLKKLPEKYRFGLIERRILWEIVSDIYRPDLELAANEYELLMEIFDRQEMALSDALAIPSPTLRTYLDYCKVAYLSNFAKTQSHVKKQMSGLEMYKAMADGRHEGLIDISMDSSEELAAWYRSGRGGGHPWEICRGGNATHIDLGVLHENGKWFVFLNGNSTGRMVETARMALAFYKRKMPFRWVGFNDVRLKMEGRDNIGIIPERYSLHRANQLFENNDRVFDCLHYDDLGAAKKSARGFITFLPIEPLYPKEARLKNDRREK